MLDTGVVATWVGLIGVIAGALIAFGSQYLVSRTERQERNTGFVLEQCALVIALSEDHRSRVWEERQGTAVDLVAKWDIGAYRLAEARLRVLSQEPNLLAALEALRESGKELGLAWFGAVDEAVVDTAWAANRAAIERFVTVSLSGRRPPFYPESPETRSADEGSEREHLASQRPQWAGVREHGMRRCGVQEDAPGGLADSYVTADATTQCPRRGCPGRILFRARPLRQGHAHPPFVGHGSRLSRNA